MRSLDSISLSPSTTYFGCDRHPNQNTTHASSRRRKSETVVAEGHKESCLLSRRLRCFACMWRLGQNTHCVFRASYSPFKISWDEKLKHSLFLGPISLGSTTSKQKKKIRKIKGKGECSRGSYRPLAVSTLHRYYSPLACAPRLEALIAGTPCQPASQYFVVHQVLALQKPCTPLQTTQAESSGFSGSGAEQRKVTQVARGFAKWRPDSESVEGTAWCSGGAGARRGPRDPAGVKPGPLGGGRDGASPSLLRSLPAPGSAP